MDERNGSKPTPPDDPNPMRENRAKGGPPEQQQQWPGSDEEMRPAADHGEHSYQGHGRLRGMRALITGGDSGIGRAIAIAFAREGADVAIGYLEEHEDARETLHWIDEADRRSLSMAGDVQDPDHCRALVARTVEAFGGLDLLVNNAAFHLEQAALTDISQDQLERTFRTNILSYIWTTQAALEHLGAGNAIINTGSKVALSAKPNLVDYSATKAAVHNFTQSVARQVADRGIRVNCVAPGPVWTPLIPATREPEAVDQFGAGSAWGRPAQPAEVAPSYVFLASADARYFTGEIITVTG